MKREIKIKTRDFTLRLPLGDGPALPTDGIGGWQETARPDGRPITDWIGAAAWKEDVPVLLDGWPRDSVERDKDRLIKLGRTRNGEEQPPSFKVSGPIFSDGMRMVLNGTPDFGSEQTIRNENGKLIRLPAMLHLMEYVSGDDIRIARRKKGGSTFTYTTKKGDTCLSIAKHFLHEPKLADKIAKMNKIRSVRKEIKPGTVLRLANDLPSFDPAKG